MSLLRPRALAATMLCAGALVACASVYADPIEAPLTFGGGFDAGPLALPPNIPKQCPLSITENGPCDEVGAACEFGSSSDPDCNATYTCVRDPSYQYWRETKAPRCAGKCPEPEQIVDGAPCSLPNRPDSGIRDDALELQCPSVDRLCACTTGPGGTLVHERRWVCVGAGDGCPVTRPNAGRSCLGDRRCDYGTCEFKRGTGMICDQGVWQVEATPCP